MSDAEIEARVIAFVASETKKKLRASRVLLFGSRARGTQSECSDYDFAVEADSALVENWSAFCATVAETAPTLNSIDLVSLNAPLTEAFRAEIFRKGIDVTSGSRKADEGGKPFAQKEN